jgi:hypothetical protein
MRVALILSASVVLLAGCQKPAAPAQAPAVGAAPAPVALTPAPYTGGALNVTAEGVGPINAATPFDKAAIQALFPNAQVDAAFLHSGEEKTPILTVQADGNQLLQIEQGQPGKIGQVRVQGGDARGPAGETLLAPWKSARFDPTDCVPGQGSDRAALICRRKGGPDLGFIFGVPGWTSEEAPPVETLEAKAFIREFTWAPLP